MRRKKLNNQGSTLLTVIILLAFIAILGTMMLSVTMTNLQMKMLERKAKENFYTCEITLDEIRAGLYELTVEETRDIYENDILTNITDHITKTESEMNLYLKNKVSLALIKKLGSAESFSDGQLLAGEEVSPKNTEIFNKYLTLPPVGGDIVLDIDIGNLSIISETELIDEVTKIKKKIRVRDIYVTLNINELESRICTDIIVELPDFSFEDGLQTTYQMEHPYKDYALIADGMIISDNTISDGATGTNTINGSLYAGDGIIVGSQMSGHHNVIINGENIVTRDKITVQDTGKLVINGISKEDPDTGLLFNVPATVWADNLLIETSDSFLSGTKPTTLNINGISLIKDDLTLNAPYSNVSLSGAYVGYTGTKSALGSSMILNGNNSSLNLSGLDSLILAGRAHVSVNDSTESTDKVTDILTGESIAIKSNQKAYLIPGRFIKGLGSDGIYKFINHNPITKKDVDEYGIPEVDFSGIDPMNDIVYTDYVNSFNPFKVASKQTVSGGEAATILRYYYLAFESGKQADDYLWRYIHFTGNEGVLDKMDPFTVANLTLPDDMDATNEILVAGNMTSYDETQTPKVDIRQGISAYSSDDTGVNSIIANYPLGHLAYHNSCLKGDDIIYTVGNLNSLYSKISHILNIESSRVYKEDDSVVESTVVPSGVDFLEDWLLLPGNSNPLVEYYGSTKDFYEDKTAGNIIIVNGNVILNNDFKGLMLVYGDGTDSDNVRIANGVTVNGMIISIDKNVGDGIRSGNIKVENDVNVIGKLIAMGDIALGSNDVFTSSELETKGFFESQGTILKYIFRNLDQTTQYARADGVKGSESITPTYQNTSDMDFVLYINMSTMHNINSRDFTITATDTSGKEGSDSLTLLRRSLFPLD